MLVVETIAKIRRAYFVQGKPIKVISRELRVSRKVIRKVLRTGATQFEYERSVQPRPKIGPWQEELDRQLSENERKPARERLTLVRLFEELRGLGYAGGYDAHRRQFKHVRSQDELLAPSRIVGGAALLKYEAQLRVACQSGDVGLSFVWSDQ